MIAASPAVIIVAPYKEAELAEIAHGWSQERVPNGIHSHTYADRRSWHRYALGEVTTHEAAVGR